MESETGEKPTWDWVNVEGLLRTYQAGRRTITWNLKPDIVLINPNKTDSNPITKLLIDIERSLQYSH